MNAIALLNGDTIIYWNQIIVILGILAGISLVFSLRSFAGIRIKAVLCWLGICAVLSFILSRLFYYYCNSEQFVSFGNLFRNLFDHRYNVMGLVFGAMLSVLIVKRLGLVKTPGNLYDTTFPGIVLTISVIRLSYFFTDTFHSTIAIKSPFWQVFPFAVSTTDSAGNTSFVFAPFLISFIILLLTAVIMSLFGRKKLKHPGDLFRLTFTCFALSEMVLESTRYDSVKLHFLLLTFLNQYVGFISFSMIVLGICILVMFVRNFIRLLKKASRIKCIALLAAFAIGFVCFGVLEYLLQRYTNSAVLFHWLQALCALVMGVSITLTVLLQRKRKSV